MKKNIIRIYLTAMAICFSVNMYANTGAPETVVVCDGKTSAICKGEINGVAYSASGNKPS